jgi:hypothetical protein
MLETRQNVSLQLLSIFLFGGNFYSEMFYWILFRDILSCRLYVHKQIAVETIFCPFINLLCLSVFPVLQSSLFVHPFLLLTFSKPKLFSLRVFYIREIVNRLSNKTMKDIDQTICFDSSTCLAVLFFISLKL